MGVQTHSKKRRPANLRRVHPHPLLKRTQKNHIDKAFAGGVDIMALLRKKTLTCKNDVVRRGKWHICGRVKVDR